MSNLVPLGIFIISCGIGLICFDFQRQIDKKLEIPQDRSAITISHDLLKGKQLGLATLSGFKVNGSDDVLEVLILKNK